MLCFFNKLLPPSNFSSWFNMISPSNGYLQLPGLGAWICFWDRTCSQPGFFRFPALLFFTKLATVQQQLFFWGLLYAGAQSTALSRELEEWGVNWIPPSNTQDIQNQFNYSFAWKQMGPLESKWLSHFTDGLFQILREGKKITRKIKYKTTVATVAPASAVQWLLLCNAVLIDSALLTSNMW